MRARTCLLIAALTACSAPSSQPANSTPPVPASAVAPLADSAFPNTPMGLAALRGRALLTATRESLPEFDGSDLQCTSCHLDEGRRPYSVPLTGVHARYPQHRVRSGLITTIQDRVNDCFKRSLAGKPLPQDDDRMRAIVAYLAFISTGTPIGGKVPGQGLDTIVAVTPDTGAGHSIYMNRCARCHAGNGSGGYFGKLRVPPAWGPRSFAIGAAMARYRVGAAFIKRNMPFDSAGVLTDQQALDVAAYLAAQPRPDSPGKENDWPKGNAPSDVPYTLRSMTGPAVRR